MDTILLAITAIATAITAAIGAMMFCLSRYPSVTSDLKIRNNTNHTIILTKIVCDGCTLPTVNKSGTVDSGITQKRIDKVLYSGQICEDIKNVVFSNGKKYTPIIEIKHDLLYFFDFSKMCIRLRPGEKIGRD